MKLNLKRVYQNNKFILGFYLGMFLMSCINTFVGYEKGDYVGVVVLAFVMSCFIVLFWLVDQEANK